MADIREQETPEIVLSRIRTFRDRLADAAVGHAATLYECRARNISAEVAEREGHVIRIIRGTRARCPHCGGLGVIYTIDEARVEITVSECRCVTYEVRYQKLLDPVAENRDAEYTTTPSPHRSPHDAASHDPP